MGNDRMETVPHIFMELMFLALKSIFRNKTLEVPFRAFKRGRCMELAAVNVRVISALVLWLNYLNPCILVSM